MKDEFSERGHIHRKELENRVTKSIRNKGSCGIVLKGGESRKGHNNSVRSKGTEGLQL